MVINMLRKPRVWDGLRLDCSTVLTDGQGNDLIGFPPIASLSKGEQPYGKVSYSTYLCDTMITHAN